MTEPNGSAYSNHAGNPEVGSGAAISDGSEGGAALSTWVDGLQSQENRAKVQTKGWRSPDDVVASYNNLESQLGRSIVPPSPDDPPEKWDVFYRAAGRPDAPDGYEFSMPGGLSQDFTYEEGLATEFRQWAHNSGLNSQQAQVLHDRFVQYQSRQFADYHGSRENAASEAHHALVARWGDPSGERFQRNIEFANRAVRNLGGDALAHALRLGGLINQDGAIANDALALALSKAGEALYAEDSLEGAGGDGANPWNEDNENLGHQGQILRQDPEKARAMIRAAGLKPSSFGLDR